MSSQAEEAKKKRLEVKEPGLNYVKVKHKATKRNFPKEDANKEVKEKQAKTSNGTPTTQNDNSIKTNGIQNGHGPQENDITMDDNEELRWIAQVTREKEEAERKAEEQRKIEEEKKKLENNKIESKESKTVKPAYKMTQQEKWLEMQRQKEEEKKKAEEKGSSSVSQARSYSSPPCHSSLFSSSDFEYSDHFDCRQTSWKTLRKPLKERGKGGWLPGSSSCSSPLSLDCVRLPETR